MTELAKHIEILLLDNDCVIVPGFGGFMAHPVSAVYNKDENLFLPPTRTLGFNPQLKINDSLLVQSYVEAYDISYPEALRRIDGDVEEIRQTLANTGSYELPDVGVLRLKDEGIYDFEPCLSGLLTPTLYALNSFEMPLLDKAKKEESLSAEDAVDEVDTEETTARTISINVDKLKHTLATAAVVLFLILFSIPLGENKRNELRLCSIDSNMLFRILPHMEENGSLPEFTVSVTERQKPIVNPADEAENKLVQEAFNEQPNEGKSTPIVDEKAPVVEKKTPTIDKKTAAVDKKIAAVENKVIEKKQEKSGYVIVLASNVKRSNAEAFVSTLQKSGVKDARILEGKHIKVVCGSFADVKSASDELNRLKETNKAVSDGWFLKI